MEQFYEKDKLEVGIDEAGRGCLFGPVFTAGVIWNKTFHDDILIIASEEKSVSSRAGHGLMENNP